MSKATHKRVKFTPEEMAYELPAEIDVRKLRHVGSGAEAVRKLAERSKHVVALDPDVAKVFNDSETVNNLLRAVIKSLPQANVKKRRKTA